MKNVLKNNNCNNSFSVLHVKIRSLNKNFENLKIVLSKTNFLFKICLTETWCQDENINKNSTFQLPNYSSIHQIRKNKKGGGVCFFIHDSLKYKLRNDFSANNEHNESLCIEIINKTNKNMIINTIYRQPDGKIKPFKKFIKNIMLKIERSNKPVYLVGDFNLNILDYEINKRVKNFFNLIFQYSLIPIINKPTRVTNKSITAIDHIITNAYLSSKINAGIIKTDISDHFPVFLVSNTPDVDQYSESTNIYKRK